MVAVLVGISLISGMALGKLNSVTKDKIAENILRFKKVPAVVSIYEGMLGKLGGEDREALEQKFLDNRKELDVGEKEPLILFLIEKDGKPETVALERPGSGGYGGAVGVMVGFNLETGDLAGVGITAHSETPGIGDRIGQDSFLYQFRGKKLPEGSKIALKKAGGDIDGVSGATRSSTAVADGIRRAKELYDQRRDQIMELVNQ